MTPYAQMIGSQMRPEAQAAFAYEYQRYSKDPSLALVLAIVLGIVGGEAYYLGEWKRGVLMSIALLTGIGLMISLPLWIVRCFTIQSEVDAYNDYVAYALAFRYGPNAFGNTEVPQPPVAPAPPQARGPRPPIVSVPMTRPI